MIRLPRLKGKEIIRMLEHAGFVVARTRRSHVIPSTLDGRTTVIPVHAGETIGPGLLRAIFRDVELTAEEFCALD